MTDIKLNWVEILLTAHKRIPQIIAGIEKLIADKALKGMFVKSGPLVESIMRDIESKVLLQQIEETVDSALDVLDYEERGTVVGHIWGESHRERAARLKIALRTVFRRYNAGLNRIAVILEARGYNEAWFKEQFDKLAYLVNVVI
ncbi:MAG: hypothetical protein LBT55_04800 [Clostridiaceae bacterium]|jgi:DNA-directed RNA polymerase specialized sigma24 family protein|nr:hypothetical protein [Clostridiaceae bacterium]